MTRSDHSSGPRKDRLASGSLRTGQQAGRRLLQEPGLISSREPSQNPPPSGTVKCPFLSREHLTYHIQDMKINMLASTDKEALHAFIYYSQTLHRICQLYICWIAKWGKDMCLLWLGLEWRVQFETLCTTNACGTPSRDIHQREEREAHTFGSQDWGSKPEVQIADIKTEKALEVLASQWKNLRNSQRGLSHLRREGKS